MASLYARGSAGIGQAAPAADTPPPTNVNVSGLWIGGALVGAGLVIAAAMRARPSQRLFGANVQLGRVDVVHWQGQGKTRRMGFV